MCVSRFRPSEEAAVASIYTLDWVVDKLVTPVAIGIVLAIFGFLAPSWIARHFQPPTCSNPRGLEQVTPTRVSGAEKPADRFPIRGLVTYRVRNLVDGNTSTAWVEDKPGLGLGSYVDLRFDRPVDLRLVCVVNGYAQSWDLYKRNSRARLLSVVTDRGHRSAMLDDAGSPDRPASYQQISSPSGWTSHLKLEVESAYAAQQDTSRTKAYPDTSLSEVEVWARP
jgi:hypothetical protein